MARVLITGGAGFIGSNLAHRLLCEGHDVTVLDNLSRRGSLMNLTWLKESHGSNAFCFIQANLTNFDAIRQAVQGKSRIYHLAAQVAVTFSIQNPRQDFEDNAVGTFNLLEAARFAGEDPIVIYSSTNKVYGGLEHVGIIEEERRYRFASLPFGVPETQPLDLGSPYGCSKGAGDQYARDYFRVYGLRTVVMRQSCIYGYRQFGEEDQGWLAWFILAALKGQPITIYGDGKQLRDVLFIDDLLEIYEAAIHRIDVAAGQVYNVGGGPERTVSIWGEFGAMLTELLGHPVHVRYGCWRPGDQRVYVSDIRKTCRDLEWRPQISVREGVRHLFWWIVKHHKLIPV